MLLCVSCWWKWLIWMVALPNSFPHEYFNHCLVCYSIIAVLEHHQINESTQLSMFHQCLAPGSGFAMINVKIISVHWTVGNINYWLDTHRHWAFSAIPKYRNNLMLVSIVWNAQLNYQICYFQTVLLDQQPAARCYAGPTLVILSY